MLREILTYLRMANGIREFLRSEPIHDVRSALLAQRERREDSFLNLARNAIFDRPENPYHTLFQIAGCSYADLERSVRQEGLEPALTRLYQAGVYLTHDEFKGRVPIVRSGRSLQSDPDMFANPLVRDGLESSSSGSRSRGTRTRRNIDYQLYREAIDLFLSDALGFAGRERILILPPLPALAGLRRAMCGPRRGDHLARWFALGGTLRDSGHYRAVTE